MTRSSCLAYFRARTTLRVASVDVHRRVLLVGLRYSAPPDWCPDADVFRAFVYAAE